MNNDINDLLLDIKNRVCDDILDLVDKIEDENENELPPIQNIKKLITNDNHNIHHSSGNNINPLKSILTKINNRQNKKPLHLTEEENEISNNEEQTLQKYKQYSNQIASLKLKQTIKNLNNNQVNHNISIFSSADDLIFCTILSNIVLTLKPLFNHNALNNFSERKKNNRLLNQYIIEYLQENLIEDQKKAIDSFFDLYCEFDNSAQSDLNRFSQQNDLQKWMDKFDQCLLSTHEQNNLLKFLINTRCSIVKSLISWINVNFNHQINDIFKDFNNFDQTEKLFSLHKNILTQLNNLFNQDFFAKIQNYLEI